MTAKLIKDLTIFFKVNYPEYRYILIISSGNEGGIFIDPDMCAPCAHIALGQIIEENNLIHLEDQDNGQIN